MVEENLQEINYKIKELKEKRKKIIEENKIKNKLKNINKIKNNDSTLPNIVRRISTKFYNKYLLINDKRIENGLKKLSLPEYTSLIMRHKDWTKTIENDILFYDTNIKINKGLKNA